MGSTWWSGLGSKCLSVQQRKGRGPKIEVEKSRVQNSKMFWAVRFFV